MPENYRALHELRDVPEVPGGEVARQLGISLAAMKSRLHRAGKLPRANLDAAMAQENFRIGWLVIHS